MVIGMMLLADRHDVISHRACVKSCGLCNNNSPFKIPFTRSANAFW
jgi:hypothetical protein